MVKQNSSLGRSAQFMMIFSAICVVLNFVLAYFVEILKIPLIFLGTVGTMLGAVLFGPLYGALIGLVTNVLQAILVNPRDFPFAIVNIIVGVFFGYVGRYFRYNYKTAFFAGLIIGVICPLVGTPIAVWIYGGLTGGGTDVIFLWLAKSGKDIFSAAFWPRLYGNLIDKIFSAMTIVTLIKRLPGRR